MDPEVDVGAGLFERQREQARGRKYPVAVVERSIQIEHPALEYAGGQGGVALTAGAGWHEARRARVLEVIVRHNGARVDPAMDAEGYLLEIATGLDTSGARPDALPESFRREVLTAYPRGALSAEFGACVIDQAARKPDTAARRLLDGGIITRRTENPLECLT